MESDEIESELAKTTTDEDKRLGGDAPFITILKLCVGPLLFSLASAFQDTFELFLVKKGYGAKGVSIISIASNINSMLMALAAVFSQATIIKIGELITKRNVAEAGRLYSNMVRMTVLVGICLSAVFTFAVPKIIRALGMEEDNMPEAMKYLIPIIWGFALLFLFRLSIAALMAEGKAVLASIIQITGFAAIIVLDSLFIFVFKAPIWTLSFSFILSMGAIGIGLNIRFFMGKETIHPRCSYMIESNSPEFWNLLKLSIPGIFQIIVHVGCPIVTISTITKAAEKIKKSKQVATVLNTSAKPLKMIALPMAGSIMGLIPSATYAYHKGDIKRVKNLALSALFLPGIMVAALWPIMVFKPHLIMQIWISGSDMAEWISKITPKMFYTLPTIPISLIFGSLVVVFGRSGLATIQCIFAMATKIVSAFILFYLFSSSPEKVLFCNPIAETEDVICAVMLFLIAFKNAKQTNSSSKTLELPLFSSDEPQERVI